MKHAATLWSRRPLHMPDLKQRPPYPPITPWGWARHQCNRYDRARCTKRGKWCGHYPANQECSRAMYRKCRRVRIVAEEA